MKTLQSKKNRLPKLIRRLFTVMGSYKYDEEERSRRMDLIRFKIERHGEEKLLAAVRQERQGVNKFTYNLFLDQIKITRRV